MQHRQELDVEPEAIVLATLQRLAALQRLPDAIAGKLDDLGAQAMEGEAAAAARHSAELAKLFAAGTTAAAELATLLDSRIDISQVQADPVGSSSAFLSGARSALALANVAKADTIVAGLAAAVQDGLPEVHPKAIREAMQNGLAALIRVCLDLLRTDVLALVGTPSDHGGKVNRYFSPDYLDTLARELAERGIDAASTPQD